MTAVKGYTPLTEKQIAAMNEFKVEEEKLLRIIEYFERNSHEYDGRCVALGKTNLQQAFMWLNRAIAKPQRLQLEGDLGTQETELKD